MNKMFFLTVTVADVETVVYCNTNLQAVINYIKDHSLSYNNFRIYTSYDFLSVRFIDNKLLID